MVRHTLAMGLVLTCGSMSASRAAAPTVAAAPPPAVVGPEIARFVLRHEAIVVRAGADGPTYSLETRGGDVLVPSATAGQLAKSNPDLLRKVRDMQTAVTWAGVDD